jgi:MraZ protein
LAFHGTFEHTLDAKNRLTVPSRFRSALAGRVFLVKGQDPCLSLFPAETYEAMANAALATATPMTPQHRELSRYFFSNAQEMELDGAGRVMLPTQRRENAFCPARGSSAPCHAETPA